MKFILLFLAASIATVIAHGNESHPSIDLDVKVLDQINNSYIKRVKPIFKKSCFDCHSDKTVYPWYYKIPIVKGIIDHDIEEAKEHLEISNDFPFVGHGNIVKDLKEIKKHTLDDSMPPFKYIIFHPKAKLTDSDKKQIESWVDESLKLLPESNPKP